MKGSISSLVLVIACAVAAPAAARDDKHMVPIQAALETKDAKEKLDGGVRFFFGAQQTPKVLKTLGDDVSNRKTNSLGKTPITACNWVFLSAMIALQQRAKELGANAVVNIISYYKKNEFSSETEFECHDGAVVSGVALKGTFVVLAEP